MLLELSAQRRQRRGRGRISGVAKLRLQGLRGEALQLGCSGGIGGLGVAQRLVGQFLERVGRIRLGASIGQLPVDLFHLLSPEFVAFVLGLLEQFFLQCRRLLAEGFTYRAANSAG